MRKFILSHDMDLAVKPLAHRMPPGAVELLVDAARHVKDVKALYLAQYAISEPEPDRGVLLGVVTPPMADPDPVAHALDRELSTRFDSSDKFAILLLERDDETTGKLHEVGAGIYDAKEDSGVGGEGPLGLGTLLDDYGLVALDKQATFLASLEDGTDASLDLAAGVVTFTWGRLLKKRVSYKVQLVGTWVERTKAWTWAWADAEAHHPPGVLRAAGALRHKGERAGVVGLVTPTFDVEDLESACHLARVAVGVLDAGFYHAFPQGDATAFVLCVDPDYAPAETDPIARLVTIAPAGVAALPLGSHERALRAYAKALGLRVDGAEGAAAIRLAAPGGKSATLRFDAEGRLSGLTSP